MFSLFQNPAGTLHIPSILMFISWLITGVFIFANLRVNRDERIKAFEKESSQRQQIESLEIADQPRRISKKQAEMILERLKDIEHKPKVSVAASLLDSEAMDFATDINRILNDAGFETDFPNKFGDPSAPVMIGPPGLHMLVKDTDNTPKSAGRIQRSFLNAGVELRGIETSKSEEDFPLDRIEIRIGQK